MSELLEILPLIGTTAVGGAAFMGGWNHLIEKSSNKATRYSPSEWATLWKEKRDWLVLATQGEQKETAAESLREIASILQIAGKPLKGHQTRCQRVGLKKKAPLYENMYLTLGVHQKDDGVWYLTHSVKPSKEEPNGSQRVIVQGLEELAKRADLVPETAVEWYQKVAQLICEQASHYFLAYSASPTNMKETVAGGTAMEKMQIHLNNSVVEISVEADEIVKTEAGEVEDSPAEKVARARDLAQSMGITANPDRLSLGTLTDEEFGLIQDLRSNREQTEEGSGAGKGTDMNWGGEVDEVMTRLLADRGDLVATDSGSKQLSELQTLEKK